MKSWLAGLVVTAVAGCGGDDPIEPRRSTHSIRLEITWPLATNPSMDVTRFWESSPIGCGAVEGACDDLVMADFDSEEVVLVQFSNFCVPGETKSQSFVQAYNTAIDIGPGPFPENLCIVPVDWICQDGLQQILVETPEDDPACQVPIG